ncbi:hypothetical protein [Noviherbaspirillum agri]
MPRNALQWETERQNRVHQEAVEQKKKQMHLDKAGTRVQPAENMIREVSLSRDLPDGVEEVVQQRTDALRRIPDMRSALVPFDDDAEGESWSKPFSLMKADLDPWLSYYKGYATSRLFLDVPPADSPASAVSRNEASIDYAVRALLELKRADPKIILDPPVLISQPVEYIEFEAELKACSNPLQAATLLKYATEAHENQLRQAVERGRDMGNRLYDALMGEGHANLIRAWEKVFKRKPNVEELHLMLTTGRIKVSRTRSSAVIEPKESPNDVSAPALGRRPEPEVPPLRLEPQIKKLQVPAPLSVENKEEKLAAATAMPQKSEKVVATKHKTFFYLHAAIGLAALAAYGMWMFS